MPEKALVAARPWTGEEARAGLLQAGSSTEIDLGPTRLRFISEPLITSEDGRRLRAVRIDLDGDQPPALTAADVEINTVEGDPITARGVDSPSGTVRLLIPAVEQDQKIRLSIPKLGSAATAEIINDVVREWTIHLVHHSHLDIGYTDPQPRIQAEQRSYLDSALDLARATDDWPAAARFKWAVESLWNFEQWAELRPKADVDEFCRRVKDGQIELTAMPYNLHTDTCSTDELHELLRSAREVRDRYGINFSTAMQTDVPGTVAGFPDALAEVGVRYLSVAHNWAGRSMPHTNGGDDLPRLFYWKTPAGNKVLVWMTDSPHGLAYMEGPFLGFHDQYATVDRLLPAYLASTANNSYPFPPGVFGWHGEPVTSRAPYPWDILHIRTQGWIGDNAPARLAAAKIVRQWNDTWEWPKLKISTNEEFFAAAEERLGDQLQTFEGDWGDWWVEGVGSAALPQSIVRRAQARVTDSQVLSQFDRLLGGTGNPTEAEQARDSYRSISMFNEHTWGASNSWLFGDEGFDSGELQWHWKSSHSLVADERTEAFQEKSAAFLSGRLSIGPDATTSVYAINTQNVHRSTTVRFLLRESVIDLDTAITVTDGRTGQPLPYTQEPQQNLTHRESGRWIRVRVTDVPPVGMVRLDITANTAQTETMIDSDAADGGLPGLEHDDRHGSRLPDVPRSQLLTLSNEFLEVRFDDQRTCITSIIDRTTGRELVNQDSVVGFNGYVYDTYTSAGGYNHQSNKTETGPKLELLGSRDLARPCAVLERTDDAIESRLVIEFAAPGVDRGQTTLRLRHGEPVLHIENRLCKPSTMTKESAFFAFPFNLDQPTVRYEISGGLTGDGLEHVPGAPQHMRAIRDWVTLSQDDQQLAWVTKDAPLVHPETIALPYAPFPDSVTPREPGTIYSWVHNNVWDTNFPVQQGFDATFSYAIGVDAGRGQSAAGLGLATAAEVVHPLIGITARGTGGAAAASRQLLSIDDDRVKVVSILGAQDGDADGGVQVRLQSFADEPITVALRPDWAVSDARLTSYLGDVIEDLEVGDGVVRVPLPRLGALAVQLGDGRR